METKLFLLSRVCSDSTYRLTTYTLLIHLMFENLLPAQGPNYFAVPCLFLFLAFIVCSGYTYIIRYIYILTAYILAPQDKLNGNVVLEDGGFIYTFNDAKLSLH